MPIDYLAAKKASDNELSNLVSGRNINDELTRTRQSIGSLRGRFLKRTNELISGISPLGRSSVMSRLPEVDVKTQQMLSRQKLALKRQKWNAIFNNAFDMAEQAGLDKNSAEQYAKQLADQLNEQEYLAAENNKDRGQKMKMNTLRNEYADRGIALENEYSQSSGMGPALTRILLNSGTNIGLSYLLRNRGTKPQQTVSGGNYADTGSNYRDILNKRFAQDDFRNNVSNPLLKNYGIRGQF